MLGTTPLDPVRLCYEAVSVHPLAFSQDLLASVVPTAAPSPGGHAAGVVASDV